jgi:hypothetical protein
MRHERFFCAENSRDHAEAIYGTVALIRSWFLLEYPGAWRKEATNSRLLSPEVKDYLGRLPVDRTVLIRQSHRQTEPLRCYFVRSCDDPPATVAHSIADFAHLTSLEGRGEPAPQLMFAVCTHGVHDRCCARFGLPVWCALRDHAAARAWQCSHVGGDRFAGNVVVFPYGIYYGRVLPEHVPEIIRSSDAGDIWLPGYRGRSCFPRAAQVAEYFVRAESGRLRIDEFRLVKVSRTGRVTTVVLEARNDATVHTVEFFTRPDAMHQRLTCETSEESPIAQHELRSYKTGKALNGMNAGESV